VKETTKPTVSSMFLAAEPTLCFQDLAILLQFSRQSACHFAGALMAPVTQGRQAATWPEWAAIREQVLGCTGWRCQACGVRRRLEVHHVVKRSQAGSDLDLDLLVALCRWCHDQTHAPNERGRLVVTALGAGQFTCEVVQRADSGQGPDICPRRQNSPFAVVTVGNFLHFQQGAQKCP
jgi:5-methylcytosine-specific restriction endonuclease McrA